MDEIKPQQELTLVIKRNDGSTQNVKVKSRIDTADRGGLLQARRHPALRAAGDPAGGVSRRADPAGALVYVASGECVGGRLSS